jgi:hypothetical protein
MGLNKAFDRSFFLIDGAVKTTGGSLNLAKGQLAAVDQTKATAEGLKVISTFAGSAKDKKNFSLRVGIEAKTPGRSYSDKSYSTVPFALSEVKELSVSAPKITEHIVDEVVIGYDGTPGSEFNFKTGDAYFRIALHLKGGAIDFRGGRDGEEFLGVNIDVPKCNPFDDCADCDGCAATDAKAIILEAVERIRRKQLTGGGKVEDFIDVTPILKCDNDITASLIPYHFYTLELCDTGDDVAKAIVAAQYNTPVKRIDRKGSISTYQVLLASAPANFSLSIPSFIKGCDACPGSYTEVPGGFVYAFTVEDAGVDKTSVIEGVTNVVSGTVVKSGNNAGVGFYTAVASAKITDAAIATLIASGQPNNTFTVNLVGKVKDICTDGTTTQTAWTLGSIVNAVQEAYDLWLADDTCGASRLEELQGAYPNLTIALAQYKTATLTGTSGEVDFTIGGDTYAAIFDTSLAKTATNFVSANGATILTDHGVSVTASNGVLTFVNVGVALPTITEANDSGDLAATLGAVTTYHAGCQTKYTTSVISNLVGAECDAIYKDVYVTVRPAAFQSIDWTLSALEASVTPAGNCKAGIRFKSKVFQLDGDEALRNIVGFTETSTQIQVSAGFPDEIREGIGRLPQGGYTGKYLSRQQHRTHLAGNLRNLEFEGKAYFRNISNDKDYLGRLLRGETSNMQDNTKQYIQYKLKVSSFNHTQGFAGRINDDINYNFFVEVGKHQAVEDLLNNLAANAGVATVAAFG